MAYFWSGQGFIQDFEVGGELASVPGRFFSKDTEGRKKTGLVSIALVIVRMCYPVLFLCFYLC